jgi:hypothetical protein
MLMAIGMCVLGKQLSRHQRGRGRPCSHPSQSPPHFVSYLHPIRFLRLAKTRHAVARVRGAVISMFHYHFFEFYHHSNTHCPYVYIQIRIHYSARRVVRRHACLHAHYLCLLSLLLLVHVVHILFCTASAGMRIRIISLYVFYSSRS